MLDKYYNDSGYGTKLRKNKYLSSSIKDKKQAGEGTFGKKSSKGQYFGHEAGEDEPHKNEVNVGPFETNIASPTLSQNEGQPEQLSADNDNQALLPNRVIRAKNHVNMSESFKHKGSKSSQRDKSQFRPIAKDNGSKFI